MYTMSNQYIGSPSSLWTEKHIYKSGSVIHLDGDEYILQICPAMNLSNTHSLSLVAPGEE